LRTPRFNAVLFDIDNVLVDTRASYLAAIQKTVEHYLNRPGVVSAKEIDQFKLLGGFNDDWDCCYGIITFLETVIQGKPIRFGDHRRQRFSIPELGRIFPQRPLGLEGLLKNLRVLYERVETPSYNRISQIFQQIYWGKRGEGLVRKEKPIFLKSLLGKIRQKGVRFGIVTGRNRVEAKYALKRFGILNLFDCLITIDEVRREEKKTGKVLRKPHPWPILEAARQLFGTGSLRDDLARKCVPGRTGVVLYIGDLPDDILAAKRAGKFIRIKSAAFPKFTRDPETTTRELQKLKPDFFLESPRDLSRILFL